MLKLIINIFVLIKKHLMSINYKIIRAICQLTFFLNRSLISRNIQIINLTFFHSLFQSIVNRYGLFFK